MANKNKSKKRHKITITNKVEESVVNTKDDSVVNTKEAGSISSWDSSREQRIKSIVSGAGLTFLLLLVMLCMLANRDNKSLVDSANSSLHNNISLDYSGELSTVLDGKTSKTILKGSYQNDGDNLFTSFAISKQGTEDDGTVDVDVYALNFKDDSYSLYYNVSDSTFMKASLSSESVTFDTSMFQITDIDVKRYGFLGLGDYKVSGVVNLNNCFKGDAYEVVDNYLYKYGFSLKTLDLAVDLDFSCFGRLKGIEIHFLDKLDKALKDAGGKFEITGKVNKVSGVSVEITDKLKEDMTVTMQSTTLIKDNTSVDSNLDEETLDDVKYKDLDDEKVISYYKFDKSYIDSNDISKACKNKLQYKKVNETQDEIIENLQTYMNCYTERAFFAYLDGNTDLNENEIKAINYIIEFGWVDTKGFDLIEVPKGVKVR